MSAYSLLPTLDAVFRIMEGEGSVMVRSESRMKFKSASVGAAELRLAWLPPSGKASRWRLKPSFLSAESLEFSTSDVDDGSQLYDIDLEDVFPAFGLVMSDCSGVIRALAVHFEPEDSPDFWIFLLHTGWVPPKPSVEVPSLSLVDGGNEVGATIDVGNNGVGVVACRVDRRRNGVRGLPCRLPSCRQGFVELEHPVLVRTAPRTNHLSAR